MRTILAAIALLFELSAVQAATVQVDLSTLGVVGSWYGSCYCGSGPVFGAYYGNPGDTIDFGTYTFIPEADTHSFYRNQQYADPNYPDEFKLMGYNVGNYSASFAPDRPLFITTVFEFSPYLGPPPQGATVNLIFTLQSSGFIQLGFNAPGIYTPAAIAAIPEPSTWAMLLIGFASVGWAAFRHRRIVARTV